MLKLLEKLGVQYTTEGHKHCRPGWANMECPFCIGNPGLHLGWNIEKRYFYCWRCGYHKVVPTLSKLSGMPSLHIQHMLMDYRWGRRPPTKVKREEIERKRFCLPTHTGELQTHHQKYLINRGYNPTELIRTWGIMGTSPISVIKEEKYLVGYGNRILCPIEWDGMTVSFQTRALNNEIEPRYKACPTNREIIHHKDILYGRQDLWDEIGICVEGIFDVWRFGINAFATFGIKYTKAQILQIVKHFTKVVIIFDDDPQAIQEAKKLQGELRAYGVSTKHIEIKGDPGAMNQTEANNVVEEVLSWNEL